MTLKILNIIYSLDLKLGGMQEGLAQITPHLIKKGIKSTVITLDDPASEFLKNFPFEVIGLGPVASKYGYKRGLPKIIKKIAHKYDLVIIHGIWQYHSFATWRALKNCKVPYFVYTHGQLDPYFKRSFPIKHLKKMIYWPWTDYKVLRDAKGVLFTTDKEKILARESFWLYKANEIVVGFGTSKPPENKESDKNLFLKTYSHLKDKKILLFLSRIHPKKGLDILIKAFSDFALKDESLELVIAGPDPLGMKKELIKISKNLGINNRITWTGMLVEDMKWSAFRASDLFCLTSHSENFGIAVVEALACGLPVLITKPINIWEIIDEAGAGIVCDDNLDSSRNALKKWICLSSSERNKMRKNAKDLFYKQFDFVSNSNELINKLKKLVKNY